MFQNFFFGEKVKELKIKKSNAQSNIYQFKNDRRHYSQVLVKLIYLFIEIYFKQKLKKKSIQLFN